MSSKTTNLDKLYGNNKVFAPSGELMFLGSKKKINWYLKNNLADVIEVEGKNTHIKLNFVPKDIGHSKNGLDPYYLAKKLNICVVSGSSDGTYLTKHHIIPYCFRKWFPEEYKSRSSHDIVLITRDLHHQYENKYADDFKNEIGIEYGVGSLKDCGKINAAKSFNKGLAHTIINQHKNMPMDKLLNMMIRFETNTNIKPTIWNLKDYIISYNIEANKNRKTNDWGKFVVEKITDLQEFSEIWRQHFIDSMSPKHMPDGWRINRGIERN